MSARAFYLEASYGQTTIVGATGGRHAPTCTARTPSRTVRPDQILNGAFAAANPQLDFGAYDRIVISWNSACGSGGVGTVFRTLGDLEGNGVVQYLSVSLDFNDALGSTAQRPDRRRGAARVRPQPRRLARQHPRVRLGRDRRRPAAAPSTTTRPTSWATPAATATSTPSTRTSSAGSGGRTVVATEGSYTVNPYEDAATRKVLKVPRTRDGTGEVTGYYYLEYRKPTASWNNFATGRPDYGNGVLVHTSRPDAVLHLFCGPDFFGPGGGGDTNLIDTQPGSVSGTNDFNDAPLAQSERSPTRRRRDHAGHRDDRHQRDRQITFARRSARSGRWSTRPRWLGHRRGHLRGRPAVTLTAPDRLLRHWRENRADQRTPTRTPSRSRPTGCLKPCSPRLRRGSGQRHLPRAPRRGQQTVNTATATTEAGEPTTHLRRRIVTTGRTVWYTVTPSTTGQMTLYTAGSAFDTVLAVYTGSAVNGLTRVACNDDADAPHVAAPVHRPGWHDLPGPGRWLHAAGGRRPERRMAVAGSDPRQEGRFECLRRAECWRHCHLHGRCQELRRASRPAIRPYIDGASPAGPPGGRTSPAASAVIQPGQTVTFTFQRPLGTAAPGARPVSGSGTTRATRSGKHCRPTARTRRSGSRSR